ncbi:MAG: bifunctional riboflavin kinase/FAD synthetase, partial [Gammaproteobacteria bacterium]|nr:bifunctional riboflavin kinase/FAD synthetase [Gammaproteobacteria bacterium]
MEFIRGMSNLRQRHRGCVLTIGNYDGVHRGHQAVLTDLSARARELDCPAAVVVFEPTPQEFFGGAKAPARLSSLREKLRLLQASKVDRVICVRFNRAVAAMTPQSFIEKLVEDGLGARHVTVGADFRFGRDRTGDFHTLVEAGNAGGYTVAATADFELDGTRVSSSAVRDALAGGDLATAA